MLFPEEKTGQSENTQNPDDVVVAGIDFNDVPENIRDMVKQKTILKGKLLQAGETRKFEEIAADKKKLELRAERLGNLERIQDALEKDPKLNEKITKVWEDHVSGKGARESKTALNDAAKLIDKKIASASTAEEREAYVEARKMIQDELEDVLPLKDKIKQLEDKLELLSSTTSLVSAERVESGIKELSEKFGTDIVSKYKDAIKAMSLKHPDWKLDKIFMQLGSEEDIQKGFEYKKQREQQRENKLRKEGLDPSGNSVITKVEPKKDPKTGKVNMREYIRDLVKSRSPS